MLANNNDYSAFDPRGVPRFPQPQIEYVAPEPADQPPGVSQLYAAAWTKAVRDHEIDKLFNADYYQGGDI